MAAQAEEPLATAAADPSPPLLRRASPDDGKAEAEKGGSRDTKRRRTCVAALESLETDKRTDCADYSFSFDARSVAPIETTPKFGSFNPVLLLETTTTTVLESTEKVSDESPVEGETVADGKAEEGKEEEEGEHDSEGKHGNSECSKTE